MKRSLAVELFWKIHPPLYRLSRGRIGGRLMNLPVLLLSTRGRRSGLLRTNALMYLPDGERFVVIASLLGEPRHPAWFLNLMAEPRARIQVGARQIEVRAREAGGDERERLWSELVARQRAYADYQGKTRRRIPVVVLEPTD